MPPAHKEKARPAALAVSPHHTGLSGYSSAAEPAGSHNHADSAVPADDRLRPNFNLVLHQESRYAAEDFNDRLKIPFIELRRLYQTDKIQNQYQALASVLGISFELDEYREAAEQGIEDFRKVCPDASFAVGECMNGDPFELALALLKYGFKVPEIYGTITAENFVYMKQLALLSPETRVFSNMEPTMIYYDPAQSGVNITIGKDALYYHQDCPGLMWNQDEQPYGFAGVRRLFEALKEVAG